MNNKFIEYYKSESKKLNDYINHFNEKITLKDNRFLKDNLEVFKKLNSDGKLIRGTLINLGYKLLKGDSEYSYPLAAAFEIFQTSILIHDDIIDNDDLRRGKTTIHKYVGDKYNSKDLGRNIAICMGDLGFYESIRMIANSYNGDSSLGKIISYFSDIVLKTIDGEILDVITPFKEINNLENDSLENDIMEVYKLKTAYYTIIGPLALGLILAGVNDKQLELIEKFGYNVGVAFQLQDDILGIYGNEIGKTVGSDIREFKTTMLYSYTKQKSNYYSELLKYYGKTTTEESIAAVRNIFENSGALEYTRNMIEKLYSDAINILDTIDFISDDDKLILNGLINYLKERNK